MSKLRPVSALDVRDLFQPDRSALTQLLHGVTPAGWATPTACAGWDVRDVALHILGGDLSNLSRRRDGIEVRTWGPGESAGAFLGRINQEWVMAARRFSPRLVVELLEWSGPPLFAYFEGLDLTAIGSRVSWAGPTPAPVWLDVAREYMERWIHQQHIRDAVGEPGQQDARFIAPVIAASTHALPLALAGGSQATANSVVLTVEGDGGGEWSVVRQDHEWRLFEGAAAGPDAHIRIAASDWWRLVTLGLGPDAARARAHAVGDIELVNAVLRSVAIIA